MRKLIVFLIAFCSVAALFTACDNTKTYAEKLADEREAIRNFIKQHNITVITEEEFGKDTVTDVSKNEYVLFSNGLYMQIVNRGEGDTIKSRDEIVVRFVEHDVLTGDTTNFNVNMPGTKYEDYASYYNKPDVFNYTVSGSTVYGQFTEGMMNYMYGTQVPAGWLYPLTYIRNDAHVKVIVPSKLGIQTAKANAYPYFYDLRKIHIN